MTRPAPASLVLLLASLGLLGCDTGPDPGEDAGSARDAGGGMDAGGGVDAGPADPDAGPADPDAGPALIPCDPASPMPPPEGSALWAMPLAGVGADTLRAGDHGHDDERGPVGFCNEAREAGQPYYRLVAAGFESDEDLNGDGDVNDALGVDFWRDASAFTGVGESGGRVNIYVDVYDEAGTRLNRDNAPELRLLLSAGGGAPMSLPLDAKPPNEFQTNFPMTGGGATFSLEVEGLSDRVYNMRLPINHHVTYLLVFQREL